MPKPTGFDWNVFLSTGLQKRDVSANDGIAFFKNDARINGMGKGPLCRLWSRAVPRIRLRYGEIVVRDHGQVFKSGRMAQHLLLGHLLKCIVEFAVKLARFFRQSGHLQLVRSVCNSAQGSECPNRIREFGSDATDPAVSETRREQTIFSVCALTRTRLVAQPNQKMQCPHH